MVVSCATPGCTNNRTKTPNLSFHRLPPNTKETQLLRKKWLHNIKRTSPLPKDIYFFVCSAHFDDSSFERDFERLN